MLNHQVQATNECVPTSIAMLLDIPKSDVILAALPDGLPNWNALMKNPPKFWHAVIILLDCAFGHGTGQKYFTLCAKRHKLDLTNCPQGKGLISMFKRSQAIGHCVAYSHGVVHDPELPIPVRWDIWRKLYANWDISGVLEVK